MCALVLCGGARSRAICCCGCAADAVPGAWAVTRACATPAQAMLRLPQQLADSGVLDNDDKGFVLVPFVSQYSKSRRRTQVYNQVAQNMVRRCTIWWKRSDAGVALIFGD